MAQLSKQMKDLLIEWNKFMTELITEQAEQYNKLIKNYLKNRWN